MLRKLFANWRLKLWALVIALAIWFYADRQTTQEIRVRAELRIAPPLGHSLLHQSATEAWFSVSGPNALLKDWQMSHEGRLALTYELAEDEVRGGRATVRLDREWVRASLFGGRAVRLKPLEVSPEEVQVYASPVESRTVPVRAPSLELAPGLRWVEPPSFTPPSVTVEGPAIAVGQLEAVEARGLVPPQPGLPGRQQVTLDREVEVQLADDLVVMVQVEIEPASVVASMQVTGEAEQERAFRGVRVRVQMLPPPAFPYVARLTEGEEAVTVLITAAPAALQRLKPGEVRAYVDVQSLADVRVEPGAQALYREAVKVQLPLNFVCNAAVVEPADVMVILQNPAE